MHFIFLCETCAIQDFIVASQWMLIILDVALPGVNVHAFMTKM